MPKHRTIAMALLGGAALAAALPIMAQQRPASGPVARYDMRAGTITGLGALGQVNPMAMMFGGGRSGGAQHELLLRLGSANAPAKGAPKAEHFMPPVAKLGKSVLLVTPREAVADPVDELPQKPKGRLLIYWGCGERAPRGQPVVIDFSKLAAGQVPPGLWTSTIIRDLGPTMANSRTYGHWPASDGKSAKPDSSLIGPHRVAGNYSPDIAFTLSKDFMAPLRSTSVQQASGSILLSWGAIPDATGYLAFVMGGKQGPGGDMGDMVMWTSSASREFGGGLSDWLSPAQVAPLVRNRTVMAPATTSCVIPQEVRRDTPDFRFGTLTAFGPEESFAYPPRPDDARTPWNLQWTARIRHRSMTSWMEAQGMTMGGMDQGQAPSASTPDRCRPGRGGLGGLLGGALGLPGC